MTAERMPFDVAMRRAVAARGLTLDRLAERLTAAGAPVSVSTLSNWQRGRTIPATPSSRQAVAELERILQLPEGTLLETLAPYTGTDRKLPTRTGLTQAASKRMRARLGLSDPGLVAVRMDDYLHLTANGSESETRLIVRAERPGVDRFLVIRHPVDAIERIEAGPTCSLGGTYRDRVAGLIAVELRFDAPLTRGELYPLSYRLVQPGRGAGGYEGSWTKPGLTSYSLTIEYDEDVRPSQVYRVWRTDAHTPHTRVADVRLIQGRFAHLWLLDPPAGFHGIRWEA
jgi:transcriptional regulator with XRE-family HTH domain